MSRHANPIDLIQSNQTEIALTFRRGRFDLYKKKIHMLHETRSYLVITANQNMSVWEFDVTDGSALPVEIFNRSRIWRSGLQESNHIGIIGVELYQQTVLKRQGVARNEMEVLEINYQGYNASSKAERFKDKDLKEFLSKIGLEEVCDFVAEYYSEKSDNVSKFKAKAFKDAAIFIDSRLETRALAPMLA